MKKIYMLCLLVFSIAALSFSVEEAGSFSPAGTYSGNCRQGHTAQVELKINDDHTFQYDNTSDPKKIVRVKGTWTYQGNTLLLKSSETNISFPRKWKTDQNPKCLKTRQGMQFIRLCNC